VLESEKNKWKNVWGFFKGYAHFLGHKLGLYPPKDMESFTNMVDFKRFIKSSL
jgi:hypothetical protein